MSSSNAFADAKQFSSYLIGFLISILTMVLMKAAWYIIKKFSVRVMMKLDDVGGFAQQLQAKSRRSTLQRTYTLNPDDHPDPKIYIFCIVMHDKNM